MLALQAWCVGKDGPDAEMVNSQLFSLNAGLVALQASLSFMPDTVSYTHLRAHET